MKVKVDMINNTIYFKLTDSKIIESEEIEAGIILDYDDKNNIIGIELLPQSFSS